MDVLEYYNPTIDWQKFAQKPISDDVWSVFQDLVRLCHAYKHWHIAARQHGRSRSPTPIYSESAYAKRKRIDEWRAQGSIFSDHKYRAAFLAAEKVWQIAQLVQDRKHSADWQLSFALILATGLEYGSLTSHERAQFNILAFQEFAAEIEITAEPDVMAAKWRTAAEVRSMSA